MDAHALCSASIEAFDPPSGAFFDGPSYRLVGVDANDASVELEVTASSYFDGLDTSGVLAFEHASRTLHAGRRLGSRRLGPYRRWLGDPFDLRRRAGLPGICVLTIRSDSDRSYFFMHERSGRGVAYAANVTHVAPAGEFQPHSGALSVWRSDANLWRTVVREYAEEFLDAPESTGDQGVAINYSRDEPYCSIDAARLSGEVDVRYLGLGLDPVTWKPEICLVCRWDAQAFDRVFERMSTVNREGTLMVGERSGATFIGMEFNEDLVMAYATRPQTLPAGRACLLLAWRWRAELGIPAPAAG